MYLIVGLYNLIFNNYSVYRLREFLKTYSPLEGHYAPASAHNQFTPSFCLMVQYFEAHLPSHLFQEAFLKVSTF